MISLFLLSALAILASCTAANVNVTGLLSQLINPPGFTTDTPTGTLTGSGIKLVGRVTSMQAATLSGGGITLSQGVVK